MSIYFGFSESEDLFDNYNRQYYSFYNINVTPNEENNYNLFPFEENIITPKLFEDDEENEKPNTELYFIKNNTNNNNIDNINTKEKTYNKIEIIPKPKVFYIEKIKKVNKNKSKNLLGRKRNSDKEISNNDPNKKQHTKNAFDNISRKIRGKIFGAVLIFLNKVFNEEEEIDLDDPIFPKGKQRKRKIPIQNVSFLQINQEIIIQNNVSENLNLLNKTLREIFSGSVSKKVKNYGLDHNQLLIQKIKESKGKARTNKILDMTFLQCLEHFRKSKMYEELSGLELQYDNMIEEMNEKHEKEYMDNFVECLNNYEALYRQKRPKKRHQSEIGDNTEYNSSY
jgi:hypothetical protein